ncbi:cytochrome P450 10-like isoform X3 [Montipora capricornis]
MRPKTVEENLDNFNAVADDAVSRFVKLKEACGPDDCIPDLEGEMSKFATESIGTMAFDSRLGLYNDQPPKEALKYIRANHEFFTLSQKLIFSIPSNLVRPYMDTPTLKKFFKAADVALEIGNGFVNKKIKELNEQAEKGVEASSDVVPVLAYLYAKEELTREEKNGLALELVGGGVHTTANLLLWLLYNLGTFPRIQEKLIQEIDKVVGYKSYITAEHIAKMPYLKFCVKESLRFTPTVAILSRVLDQDVVLSGYHVPAKTIVVIDLFSACHNENIFKDPSEFRPERWMRENKDEQHAFANLQFGYGVRMCVGRRIAEMEVYLLICKLLQRFRIEYNNEPLESIQMMFLAPDKPVKIKFVDRV